MLEYNGLRNLDELRGNTLKAEDGEIGRCKDFLFDDQFWAVRHVVADTDKWLPGRKILISPLGLKSPDRESDRIPIDMTKRQIEDSPGLEPDEPISRKHEVGLCRHYGWPFYWIGGKAWGTMDLPDRPQGEPGPELDPREAGSENHHLRSVDEMMGTRIRAMDYEIGPVDGLIVDEESWIIRYWVVDTNNWLPGKKVLISPNWAEDVNWSKRQVIVDLPREQVKNSPEYDPLAMVDRDYEMRLYHHYHRTRYWL